MNTCHLIFFSVVISLVPMLAWIIVSMMVYQMVASIAHKITQLIILAQVIKIVNFIAAE